ncbi:hypothetical protein CY34DRAFT_803688 [Suillus luteus UH-Slu-Lm8-n1]|uniref:Uncharacterized protein n=1 Tax=Suillus luteus UH-Slu-Lm8-n1 TaxID=930992 RepID=A0A0D0BBF4_9AGAM|nr:hypothetical protein CY34DRAFT_803688 [Suillus luteus UH-Slu-Lm8-n1]
MIVKLIDSNPNVEGLLCTYQVLGYDKYMSIDMRMTNTYQHRSRKRRPLCTLDSTTIVLAYKQRSSKV